MMMSALFPLLEEEFAILHADIFNVKLKKEL